MKLTVIGGGGVRCILLAKSLAHAAKAIGLTDIVFMDNDEEKLQIFGNLAKVAAQRINSEIRFLLSTNAEESVRDADFVITTIRAGQDKLRIADEKIALKYDVLGQETTGAGGFSMAMRSIPDLLKYCELIKRFASPNVKVFNFTNPAGLVSQALRDCGYDFTYGICDSPSGLLHTLAKMLGCQFGELTTECYGLNHLSFFKSICLNGKDITRELLYNNDTYSQTDMRYFDTALPQRMGMLLNEYLYYYLYREQAVHNVMASGVTRGEVIQKYNQNMLRELSNLNPETDFDRCIAIFEHWYGMRESAYMQNETSTGNGRDAFKLDLFADDGGGYAGVALSYIKAMYGGDSSEMILCVPNDGAIPCLQCQDVVEVTCVIDKNGHHVKKMDGLNELSLEIIRRVKYFERTAAKAILEKDRGLAVDALMMHPLVNSYSIACKLVDEYIEANAEFCGIWK